MRPSLLKVFPNSTQYMKRGSSKEIDTLSPSAKQIFAFRQRSLQSDDIKQEEEVNPSPNNSSMVKKSPNSSQKRKSSSIYSSSHNKLQSVIIKETPTQKPQWSMVNIISILKRFMIKLQQQSGLQSFWKLNTNHFKLINDKAYVIKDHKINRIRNLLFSSIYLVIYFVQNNIPVFMPDNIWVISYKMILWFNLITQLLTIPLQLSFNLNYQDDYWTLFLFIYLPTVVCIIDNFLSFNMAYYEEGQIMTDRKKIIIQYLKFKFWLDLVTSIILLLNNQQYGWNRLIFFFRMYEIGSIVEEVDERFQIQQRFSAAWTLMKLVLQVFITAHICCCAFHYIAASELELGDTDTWLNAKQLVDADWTDRYLSSLYFTFITMCTVGYGDITPQTSKEMIYVIIVTMFSCGQFGYVINTIGQIFMERTQKQANYKIKKYDISNYMRQRGISYQLQVQVFKYLDYIRRKEDFAPEKGQNILMDISQKLRSEVFKEFYGNSIRHVKLFQHNFSDKFIEELSQYINEVLFGPGELIYNSGEQDSRFFIILKGAVEIFIQDKNHQKYSTTTLMKGECFGQNSFITGQLRESSAISTNISHMLFCKQEDFIRILQKYPLDYENYCMIRDEILFYNKNIYAYCQPCNNVSHSLDKCPRMHLAKSKEYIIAKYCYSKPHQKRIKYDRKTQIKFKTLKEKQKTGESLKKFRLKIIKRVQKQQGESDTLQQSPCVYQSKQQTLVIQVNKPVISFGQYTRSDSSVSSDDENLQCTDKQFLLTQPKIIISPDGKLDLEEITQEVSSEDSYDESEQSQLSNNLIQEQDESLEEDESSEEQKINRRKSNSNYMRNDINTALQKQDAVRMETKTSEKSGSNKLILLPDAVQNGDTQSQKDSCTKVSLRNISEQGDNDNMPSIVLLTENQEDQNLLGIQKQQNTQDINPMSLKANEPNYYQQGNINQNDLQGQQFIQNVQNALQTQKNLIAKKRRKSSVSQQQQRKVSLLQKTHLQIQSLIQNYQILLNEIQSSGPAPPGISNSLKEKDRQKLMRRRSTLANPNQIQQFDSIQAKEGCLNQQLQGSINTNTKNQNLLTIKPEKDQIQQGDFIYLDDNSVQNNGTIFMDKDEDEHQMVKSGGIAQYSQELNPLSIKKTYLEDQNAKLFHSSTLDKQMNKIDQQPGILINQAPINKLDFQMTKQRKCSIKQSLKGQQYNNKKIDQYLEFIGPKKLSINDAPIIDNQVALAAFNKQGEFIGSKKLSLNDAPLIDNQVTLAFNKQGEPPNLNNYNSQQLQPFINEENKNFDGGIYDQQFAKQQLNYSITGINRPSFGKNSAFTEEENAFYKIKDQEVFIRDFEKIQEFKSYFPHNNFSIVNKKKNLKKLFNKRLKYTSTPMNAKGSQMRKHSNSNIGNIKQLRRTSEESI